MTSKKELTDPLDLPAGLIENPIVNKLLNRQEGKHNNRKHKYPKLQSTTGLDA